ncbi:response regulator [bacterium]|nr:response regulator [bacterium]
MNHSTLVAIVDDDPAPRRGLVRLLNAAGYETRDHASAEELLRDLDAGGLAFGCLILDARLPGRPLQAFRGDLSTRGIEVPCIVVTADDSNETRQMAREINAVGFFSKPVDGMALLDAVRWAVPETSSAARRELGCPSQEGKSNQANTKNQIR